MIELGNLSINPQIIVVFVFGLIILTIFITFSKDLITVLQPLKLSLTIVVIIILLSFFAGLAINNLPYLSSLFPTKNLSLYTNPSLLPAEESLLRSLTGLVEGEIKKIDGNKITLASKDDEIVVILSERFVKSEEVSKEATDSSGRRVPARPVLPDLKVGDKVQVGLGVVNGETVVTSIFVDTISQ